MKQFGNFKQAIELADKNMEVNLADTADALQAVIVISDGFELGEEDCQTVYTMLKNFMDVNMAFVFGIFPNGEDKIFKDILSNYVYNYSFEDAAYLFNQENGQIFTDLTDQLVLNIDPWLEVTNTNNVQVTDEIHLIVDNELLHGSLLEIEYEIITYALNGLVDVAITDYVGETGMVYDADAQLLTEDLTNKEIGWRESEDGVTYSKAFEEENENEDSSNSQGNLPTSVGKKIVLSKLISTNDINIYVNTAVCGSSSYGVGEDSATSYRRTVKSEYVRIIPPTGTVNKYIILTIIVSTIIIFILIVFLIKKKKISKLNKMKTK